MRYKLKFTRKESSKIEIVRYIFQQKLKKEFTLVSRRHGIV